MTTVAESLTRRRARQHRSGHLDGQCAVSVGGVIVHLSPRQLSSPAAGARDRPGRVIATGSALSRRGSDRTSFNPSAQQSICWSVNRPDGVISTGSSLPASWSDRTSFTPMLSSPTAGACDVRCSHRVAAAISQWAAASSRCAAYATAS